MSFQHLEWIKDLKNKRHGRIKDGREDRNCINYMKGANIAGFVKVADAMLAQGIV